MAPNFRWIEIASGLRSKRQALYQGYLFGLDTTVANVAYFHCIDDQCTMRAKNTAGTFEITTDTVHNHPDHQIEVEVARMYAQLKVDARDTDENVNDLYERAMRHVSLCLFSRFSNRFSNRLSNRLSSKIYLKFYIFLSF